MRPVVTIDEDDGSLDIRLGDTVVYRAAIADNPEAERTELEEALCKIYLQGVRDEHARKDKTLVSRVTVANALHAVIQSVLTGKES